MARKEHLQEYPAPEATHEQVLEDRDLFQSTLTNLLTHLGIKLKMPKVGGTEVDLHRLYKEVTTLGGLDSVTHRKQWVLACEPFNFPPSFTNKSFVMKKLYVTSLHHYEQLYFFRHQGPIVPPPLIVMPANTASPKRRRTCKTEPCAPMEHVVVVPDGPSSNSATTSCAMKSLEAGTRFTGVIDSVLGHGFRITLQLPNQCLQGVLYRQVHTEPPPAGAAAGKPHHAKAGPTTTHTDDDTAMSQELDSRHHIQSKEPLPTRPASASAVTAAPPPPRPPRSAYQFFQMGVDKNQLLQLHPHLASLRPEDLLPNLMMELWHQMTTEQRFPFFSMAARDKARYEPEWEDYVNQLQESGARLEPAEPPQRLDLWPPPSPMNFNVKMHMQQHHHLLPLPPVMEDVTPRYAPHFMFGNPDGLHTPPAQMEAPAQRPAPMHHGPHHAQRRMCLGIPVPPPQRPHYLPIAQSLHPLKAPAPGSFYPPMQQQQQRFAPPGPSPHACGPDLDLLPPDMEPEDLDHLCHYQQDLKTFRFDLARDIAGAAFAGPPPMQGHAGMDAFSMDMDAMAASGQGGRQLDGGMGSGMFGCSTPEKCGDGHTC